MSKTTETNNKHADALTIDALLAKWDRLSGNLLRSPIKAPILLPDLFLVAPNGADLSVEVNRITDYLLEKKNLMAFYGDVSSFEFYLNYCEPNTQFTEISRLMKEVKTAAGFRNHYKGVIHINVSEWVNHCTEKYFREFLNYLAENSNHWMVILSAAVKDNNIEKIEAMESISTMFLRLETLYIELPEKEVFLQSIGQRLSAYGITLDESAKKLLLRTLNVLCQNRYFDSAWVVDNLSGDIVYSIFSRTGTPSPVLTEEDLKDFDEHGEYTDRTITRMNRHKIGFES